MKKVFALVLLLCGLAKAQPIPVPARTPFLELKGSQKGITYKPTYYGTIDNPGASTPGPNIGPYVWFFDDFAQPTQPSGPYGRDNQTAALGYNGGVVNGFFHDNDDLTMGIRWEPYWINADDRWVELIFACATPDLTDHRALQINWIFGDPADPNDFIDSAVIIKANQTQVNKDDGTQIAKFWDNAQFYKPLLVQVDEDPYISFYAGPGGATQKSRIAFQWSDNTLYLGAAIGSWGDTTHKTRISTTGDFTISSGQTTITSGHLTLSSGNLGLTSGNLTQSSGVFTVTAPSSAGEVPITATKTYSGSSSDIVLARGISATVTESGSSTSRYTRGLDLTATMGVSPTSKSRLQGARIAYGGTAAMSAGTHFWCGVDPVKNSNVASHSGGSIARVDYWSGTSTALSGTPAADIALSAAFGDTVLIESDRELILEGSEGDPNASGPTLPTVGDSGIKFVAASNAIDTRVNNVNITRQSAAGLTLPVVGQGFLVKEGTDATMGTATLVAGTVTVNTTKVTANSRIFLTGNSDGGTPGWVRVSARTAGTSFTITSSSGSDTSTVAWLIVEPAP